MDKPEVKFNEWLSAGFELWKNNIGVLLVASLISMILSGVTGGILAGPMWVGMILITLALHDKTEPKPQVGDLFKGFSFFLQSFLFTLVWGIIFFVAAIILMFIPFLGTLIFMAGSVLGGTFLMFALFLIADKKMDFWPASMASLNMVKKNYWPFVAIFLVAAIIGNIGGIICGIGAFVTMPIMICILTVAYRDIFSNAKAQAAPTYGPPAGGASPGGTT